MVSPRPRQHMLTQMTNIEDEHCARIATVRRFVSPENP